MCNGIFGRDDPAPTGLKILLFPFLQRCPRLRRRGDTTSPIGA